MADGKPLLVEKPRRSYVPILSEVERRAYCAAHRILTEGIRDEHPCPGGHRSAVVDHIARIIIKEFESSKLKGD